MTKLTKRFLYSPEVYRESVERIGKLSADSEPIWGTMTAAQMLAHCAEVQEVSNGKELKNTPLLVKLFKGMVRNMVVNEIPYPRNTPTHPQYRQTSERDFETEKKRLLEALERFVGVADDQREKPDHPLFGRMTAEERGWSMYKHLDHHLKQFGV